MSLEVDNHWVYVAWIRNLQFSAEDQDGEYPSVILIETANKADAKSWGDQMYADALNRDDMQQFMFSEVHRTDDERYTHGNPSGETEHDWSDIPRCFVGQRLPDTDLC